MWGTRQATRKGLSVVLASSKLETLVRLGVFRPWPVVRKNVYVSDYIYPLTPGPTDTLPCPPLRQLMNNESVGATYDDEVTVYTDPDHDPEGQRQISLVSDTWYPGTCEVGPYTIGLCMAARKISL